jgi:hypothetical protein
VGHRVDAWIVGGLAVAALLPLRPAEACGDKLAALAGGVRYERLHRSEHPARIVFYLPAGTSLATADVARLTEALERAGHRVHAVDSPDGLDARLRAREVDLVIADFERPPRTAGSTPVLQVGSGATPGTSAPAESACVTPLGRRAGRQLVRTVERVMELRSRGDANVCATPPGLQGT